jgi:hypothetical protein
MADDAVVTRTSTAQQFLAERRDYLHLELVKTGEGWSIALRIDGTYFDRELAEHMLDYWREALPDQLEDVPRDRWDAWHWPAEGRRRG